MNQEILQGLGTMHAVIVKNNAKTLQIRSDAKDGMHRGILMYEHGRILLTTDYEFPTGDAARAHMQEIIDTCKAWGEAGMPRIK